MIRIETEHLLMRPMGVADLDDFLKLHSEPAVVEFLGPATPELARQRLEVCERRWEERGHDLLAAFERSSGRFIGRVGLRYWPEFNETEAGWALCRQAWGRGYATEAARAVIDWGFDALPLTYVTAMVRPDNSRSLAVARRLGMTPIREEVLHDVPVTVHAIDRQRWGAARGQDETEALLAHVATWASLQADLVGVILVGSRAKGGARPNSDVDLVFLSREPARYVQQEDWASELGAGAVRASAHRGPLLEQRLRLASGLELDLSIGLPSWASVAPLDAGTARVLREGSRIVYDPEGILARVRDAAGL